ncbi:MAG: nucleotide exchange factor GrpE [Acidimicrobiia bacterium]
MEGEGAADPFAAEEATRDDDVIDAEVVVDATTSADDLEELRAERDGLVGDLQRMQAEFANYKKRMLRDQTAHAERANEALVEQLLPVLDNFELALMSLDAEIGENVRKGIELVYADFLDVLEKAGLARIAAQGAPFDPKEHEAVMQDDGDGEPVVADVMRTGYTLKGRVLRPAMVKVSRAQA